MSMFCRDCFYEMTTAGFLGSISGELFSMLKQWLITRNLVDAWDESMAGFATSNKIPCPICKHETSWLPASDRKKYGKKKEAKQSGVCNAKI